MFVNKTLELSRGPRRPVRALSLVSLTLLASTRADALSPSQVTAPSYRPVASSRATRIDIAPSPTGAAPLGAEKLWVRIGRVDIEDGFPDLSTAADATIKSLEGRRVNVSDIFAAAGALEQAYARNGYLLARVTVPPQRLTEGGPLKLLVIDGFIESLDLAGVPEGVRPLVRARLASLIGRKHIRIGDLERALLIAGDAPGLSLQSAIKRGETAAGVKLVLSANQKPVSEALSADNRLPASLGGWQSDATVSLNDLAGFGEQFFLSAGASPALGPEGGPRFSVVSLGASAPLGVDGFTISPDFTHSQTRPVPESGAPLTTGEFDRFDLIGAYDAIRTRAQSLKLAATLGFASQRNDAPAFGVGIDRDSYGFARTNATWTGAGAGGEALYGRLEFSQGLGGRDADAAAASGVPLSRVGASPYFHKAALDATWTQPLPVGFQFGLHAKGQWTFGAPVFVSEQFTLDGADAVSAFPDGTFSVDAGASLRAELSHPFGWGGSIWSPYVFAAGGVGQVVRPTAVEAADPRAGALGGGVRVQFALGGRAANAGAEVARQLSNEPSAPAGYRGNFNFGLQF